MAGVWDGLTIPLRSLAQEIETLRKEAQAFKYVRAALRSPGRTEDAAKRAFQKVSFLFQPDL